MFVWLVPMSVSVFKLKYYRESRLGIRHTRSVGIAVSSPSYHCLHYTSLRICLETPSKQHSTTTIFRGNPDINRSMQPFISPSSSEIGMNKHDICECYKQERYLSVTCEVCRVRGSCGQKGVLMQATATARRDANPLSHVIKGSIDA